MRYPDHLLFRESAERNERYTGHIPEAVIGIVNSMCFNVADRAVIAVISVSIFEIEVCSRFNQATVLRDYG